MAFLHGVHTPHRKNTAGKTAERLTEVKTVVLPTQMHIGAPATPAVKVGDLVKVGTLVAEGTGAVSSPIYSSVSGKVTKIADVLTSNGKTCPAVIIESDGEMAPDENIEIPQINVKLPIYHGTDESVLQLGVGHMEGTSLPIGGESTHSVLSAHRGLPSSRLFTDTPSGRSS